jgi:hypothetical protein
MRDSAPKQKYVRTFLRAGAVGKRRVFFLPPLAAAGTYVGRLKQRALCLKAHRPKGLLRKKMLEG